MLQPQKQPGWNHVSCDQSCRRIYMLRAIATRLPLAVILLVASGCAEPPTAEPTPEEDLPKPRAVPDEDYVVTPTGLKYYDFVDGTGNPVKNGDIVSVHYHAWLANGRLVDSSYLREEPFLFTVGTRQVIDGWDEGIIGMRLNGERQLVVPPELAYGSEGRDPVPPNAVMIFELRLVEIL